MNDARRLLLIGLDAFPPELLDRWCDDGTLPNLAALRAEAAYGDIESVADLFPGAVWATFSSGSSPAEHGIFHFLQFDPARMAFRRPAPDWCDYTPFWHRLGQQGVPVVAFDLPFCYPKQAPGKVVEAHGWGLHDELAEGFSQPADLLARLRSKGRSALRPDVLGPHSERMLRGQLSDLVESVEKRAVVLEGLAREFPWQVMLGVFAETHRAGHYFWGDRVTGEPQGGIKQVAMAVDRVLPRLRALAGPDDAFVVFSLHGMGGTLDLDRFSEGISDYFEPPDTPGRRFDPVSFLHRNLPSGPRRALSAALPTPIRDKLFSHHLAAGRDWSRVRTIFNPPDANLYARANMAWRESAGILNATEAAAHLDTVAGTLAALRQADGEPAVEVFRPLERYGRGARSDVLPDLVVKALPGFAGDDLLLPDGRRFHVPWRHGWRDGDHTQRGFYLQTGGGKQGGAATTLKGQDFAAAMCAELGLSFGGA